MSIRSLLRDKLPPEKLALLPKGFEVIGDLRKLNKIEGSARVADFERLLGSRTTTLYRENGCVFQLDVTKTFFSGKMYYERGRIAQKVEDGEDVLVLFSGVGPFLIPIKKKRNVSITGLDNNREACTFLRKNLGLNHIEANIILGDARQINNLFKTRFDRIVMPAPYGQDFFLDMAQFILRPGGCVHFYTFKKDFEIPHFRRLLEEKGWQIDFTRDCGDVAPRVKRYVFDLQLRNTD